MAIICGTYQRGREGHATSLRCYADEVMRGSEHMPAAGAARQKPLTRMMSPTNTSRHASGVSSPPRNTFTTLLLICARRANPVRSKPHRCGVSPRRVLDRVR